VLYLLWFFILPLFRKGQNSHRANIRVGDSPAVGL
jgi:hypothetical protein